MVLFGKISHQQTNVFTEESQSKYHKHVPLIVIIKSLLQFISQKPKKEIWTAFSKVHVINLNKRTHNKCPQNDKWMKAINTSTEHTNAAIRKEQTVYAN